MRSPLVNVDGYSRELEYSIAEFNKYLENKDNAEKTLEDILKYELPDMNVALSHIRNSTKQMDTLLKGLLRLSRIGRAAMNIVTLDINEVIKNVISTFEFQIKSAEINLEIGKLVPCAGDNVLITQVFTNIIGNAIKYLKTDAVGQIKISSNIISGQSIYCIEDNGIGIAFEHQTKIFELFHRLEPGKTEGEGLGLTIVKQILSRLDGDIKVESEVGVGSKFYIFMPFSNVSKSENRNGE